MKSRSDLKNAEVGLELRDQATPRFKIRKTKRRLGFQIVSNFIPHSAEQGETLLFCALKRCRIINIRTKLDK
jgi:hypothetical protein